MNIKDNDKKRLGRGLEAIFGEDVTALISDIEEGNEGSRQVEIKIDQIKPNPYQPRKTFEEKALKETQRPPVIRFVEYGGYSALADLAAKMARQYAADTTTLPSTLEGLFEFVRKLTYRPEQVETLRQPSITAKDGGDCDDKTILVCAWAQQRGLPWRMMFAGMSTTPEKYHHIFPQVKKDGVWVTLDATYDYMTINTLMRPYDHFKICASSEAAA